MEIINIEQDDTWTSRHVPVAAETPVGLLEIRVIQIEWRGRTFNQLDSQHWIDMETGGIAHIIFWSNA